MEKSKRKRGARSAKAAGSGKTLDISKLIDEIFEEQVVVRDGGVTRRVTCIRAIIHQLWQKSMGGSCRAHRLYMRYIRFAASQGQKGGIELRFGPDLLTAEEVMRKHKATHEQA
jgi:hypothetical protein